MIQQNFGTLKMGAEAQIPKVGFGFSVTISNVKGSYKTVNTDFTSSDYGKTIEKEYSATGAGFKLNFLLGVQYDFTNHISANIDWNLGMFGAWSNSIRAGATWRF